MAGQAMLASDHWCFKKHGFALTAPALLLLNQTALPYRVLLPMYY